MTITNLSEQDSALARFVSELRDVNMQRDPMRFRHNLRRIGWVMGYEVSKAIGGYQSTDISTPLGIAPTRLCKEPIVVGTIFRAGLPFHEGILDLFDQAENAFVSAYRYYKDKECADVGIRIEYIASPNLEGKTLILADPMLATGGSMELGYQAFCTHGTPAQVHLCSIIAARQGVDYLQEKFGEREDVHLWCAAIDPSLNAHAYIVPGLGDAGDLAYGPKL